MRSRFYGSEERIKAVQRMRCLICFATPCENAHVISKGAGGTYKDIVPLCHKHHQEQHQIGILSFQKKYDIDLSDAAKRVSNFLDLTDSPN